MKDVKIANWSTQNTCKTNRVGKNEFYIHFYPLDLGLTDRVLSFTYLPSVVLETSLRMYRPYTCRMVLFGGNPPQNT